MGANILNYVRIKGNRCRLHLIIGDTNINYRDSHVCFYMPYIVPEAWNMCIGSERGWGIRRP